MRSRVFWGIVLVFIGLVLFLDNLGILRVNIGALIFPIIIIAIGVRILMNSYFQGGSSAEKQDLSIPIGMVNNANISLNHGAGQLFLEGTDNPDVLVEGSFSGGVEHDLNINGERAQLRLRTPNEAFWSFPFTDSRGYAWNMRLSKSIPISLDLHTGASETELDLSTLKIQNLHLETGASSTRITFPAQAGYTRADIHSGAASVNMRIPDGVAAHIRIKGGLSSSSVDQARFSNHGDYYESPDYGSALNRVEIDVENGVGSVTVS